MTKHFDSLNAPWVWAQTQKPVNMCVSGYTSILIYTQSKCVCVCVHVRAGDCECEAGIVVSVCVSFTLLCMTK